MSLVSGYALALVFLVGCVWVSRYYWENLMNEERTWPNPDWAAAWIVKGLVVPVLIWALVNSGWLPGLPPLLPVVEAAKARGGSSLGALLAVSLAGGVVIAWAWGVMSLTWVVAAGYTFLETAESRQDYVGTWLICAVPALLLGSALGYFHCWFLAGCALGVAALAAAHFTSFQVPWKKRAPSYSSAIGKIKMDKFAEAEWAILRELDRAQDDCQGWLLLAELYAVHFHDLAVADRTIHELCEQPNASVSQIDLALNRLADWHLKLGEDPGPARRALETICRRFPGTHVDHMARQRLQQLPANRQELLASREPRKIRLRPAQALTSTSSTRDTADDEASAARQAEAARLASQCQERLRQDPNCVPAREQLARLLAERLGQVETAVEQMDHLLGLPDQPESKRAEWLSWIAQWQMTLRRDREAAREIFELLVAQYPQTPQGFDAQRRLSLMAVEERFRARFKR
jgi:hypothetical protein